MFTRLKKRLADEDGMRTSSPGSATRVPRTVSRESLASAGADSGEDSFSEGSASREELLVQLARRAEQVQRLEARLGEYGDQLRSVLRLKEKLELALEKQQDVAVTKAQELNELYQVNRARLAESASLALQEKDNEWRERVSILEKERHELIAKLREAEVLTAFARRDEHDEMSGLQIQEVAKVKHMLLQREEALQQAQSDTESVRVEAQSERQMVGGLREELQELKKEMKEVQRTSESLKSENMLLLSTRVDVDEARRRADTRNLELEDIVRKHRLEGQALQREVQQGGVARRVRDDHIIRLKERLANLGDIVNVDEEGRLENDGVDGTAERAKEQELQQRELEGLMQKLWEAQELQDREILARQALSEELNDKTEALRQLHMEVQRQLECTESEARRRLEQEQRASRLEAQVAALETARTIERTTAHNSITQLERDLEEHSEHLTEAKDALGALRGERDSFKTELTRQGALNEEREKQVQALHADIENLSAQNQKMESSAEQSLLKVKELQEKASLAEEERDKLRTEVSALSISLAEVQNQLEATGTEDTAQSGDQMAGGENGEVDVICVEEPTLRAELKEKRKTIRQLQQRLAEMKRMLQRELKARSEPPCTQESRRVDASTEINLAYLKHVILKFISSRESEAFHLVKAVSVLLQFDADEERLLREMLEYKASWFGTRPLPSGITRPTISSPSLR